MLGTVADCYVGACSEVCSSETYHKNGVIAGTSQSSGQRDWQSQELYCKGSTLHVQELTHTSALERRMLQPQAGELLMTSFCTHLRRFVCYLGSKHAVSALIPATCTDGDTLKGWRQAALLKLCTLSMAAVGAHSSAHVVADLFVCGHDTHLSSWMLLHKPCSVTSCRPWRQAKQPAAISSDIRRCSSHSQCGCSCKGEPDAISTCRRHAQLSLFCRLHSRGGSSHHPALLERAYQPTLDCPRLQQSKRHTTAGSGTPHWKTC